MLITFDRNSNILRVALKNSSTGAGLTGLAYNTSGLIISTIADAEGSATVYTVAASNVEDITTIGTYAAPTSGKCRFKAVDATNHPGVYEIHLADARFSVTNATKLIVSIHGAASLLQADLVIDLTQFDLQNATGTGLTAIPWNAAWDVEAQSEVTDAIVAFFGANMAAAVDTIWDEAIGDSTVTAREAMRGFTAALLGKASGLDTATAIYRNVADTVDRITATVTADGNRTVVTLSL